MIIITKKMKGMKITMKMMNSYQVFIQYIRIIQMRKEQQNLKDIRL